MKAKIQIAAFYLLAVILGGCVPSLHPLFTQNDLIFDANLVGNWASMEPNETMEFKQSKDKRYECIYIDKEKKSGNFIASLGKIGNSMYLDLYPAEPNMPENGFYASHLLPTHSFMKIELSKNILKLCSMSIDSIDSLLKSKPNAVKHEKLESDNDRVVLTAPTKELQKFMLKYGTDKKAELFKDKDASDFHRIKK
jgi:hypothetical protein